MPPRTYAVGPAPGADPARPAWLWRFDSRWLREEAVRRNPGSLRAIPAPEVSNRARRATLEGAWTLVARGVDACPLEDPPPEARASPPPLDLPVGPARPADRRARGWLAL